jgi:hypothetical protein
MILHSERKDLVLLRKRDSLRSRTGRLGMNGDSFGFKVNPETGSCKEFQRLNISRCVNQLI